MTSASLLREGKLLTPIVLPYSVNAATAALAQTITKLSGCNIKLLVMVAVLLPSLSFQLCRLNGVEDTFFSSINSLLGNRTGGDGSGNSSSIAISKRLAVWAVN